MEQEREIEIVIRIKKDFPKNWTDGQINFFLNESSFCLGSVLEDIEAYAQEHNGCICNIAYARVVPERKGNGQQTHREI